MNFKNVNTFITFNKFNILNSHGRSYLSGRGGGRPPPWKIKIFIFHLFWKIKMKLGGAGSMYNRPPPTPEGVVSFAYENSFKALNTFNTFNTEN